MFLFHIALSAGLLAFGLGACILIWSYRNAGRCIFAAKLVGWLLSAAAVISILCTIYFGILYSLEGWANCPVLQNRMRGMDMDMDMPMMQQQMHEKKLDSETPPKPKN
jgi:hypothetical protein